jgi:hypothetical protein
MSSVQTNAASIVEDTKRALQGVRGALIQLYEAVGADPTTPQVVARQFDINRNLAWKISRVISAADPFAALTHLPGESGLDIALDAFRRAGAPEAAIQGVQGAMRALDETAEMHAGDRTHLEMILDSMGLLGSPTRLESSRELAFRGNSAIWGVQAKARVTVGFAAPASDGSKLDLVLVGGFSGLRRLRQTSPWRLFRFSAYNDDGTPQVAREEAEIEPDHNGGVPRLLRRFCSPRMPSIDVAQKGAITEYTLPAGPVGNLGAFDCFFGEIVRGENAYASPDDRVGEFSSLITLPAENLIFDLILHRDVKMATPPAFSIYGFPQGLGDNIASNRKDWELPLVEPVQELAGTPPTVVTPLVPRYQDLVRAVYARMGWNPAEFFGVRVAMRHPPMQSLAVLRWELPEAP